MFDPHDPQNKLCVCTLAGKQQTVLYDRHNVQSRDSCKSSLENAFHKNT